MIAPLPSSRPLTPLLVGWSAAAASKGSNATLVSTRQWIGQNKHATQSRSSDGAVRWCWIMFGAIGDLELAIELLDAFGRKFPPRKEHPRHDLGSDSYAQRCMPNAAPQNRDVMQFSVLLHFLHKTDTRGRTLYTVCYISATQPKYYFGSDVMQNFTF